MELQPLGADYVSGVGYNVLGQPRQYTLGSGTTATASLRYYGLDVAGYPFGALQRMELQQGSSPMLVDREMTYDQVGNVTGVNDRVSGENISYGYDDLDRLTGAGAPLNETYTYSETVTKYYRALGRLIAFRRNGSLYWVGTDHLGGTVAVASSSFGLGAGMRYSPYGVSRENVDDPLTDNLFTSQKLDASVGLYWYGSRAYDQSLGRFVCADTIVPSPGNPQSLNRYSYTYNNPMRYADPTGHDPYEGMGIVVYDNPSYLPVEQRQALYEHNTAASASGASTQYVHESGGGGGGGDPWAGQGVVVLQNPSYLPVEQRQALYAHNTAAAAGGGEPASPPTISQVAGPASATYLEALSYPSRQSIGPTPVGYHRPVYTEYAMYAPGSDETMPAHDTARMGPPTPSMSEAEHNLQELYKGIVELIGSEGAPMVIKATTGVNVDAPWAAGSQLVEDHTEKPGMDPWEAARRVHQAITVTLIGPEIAGALGATKTVQTAVGLLTDLTIKKTLLP